MDMFEIVVAGSTVLSLVAVAVTEFSVARTGRFARPPVPAAPSARVIPMPQRAALVAEALRKAA